LQDRFKERPHEVVHEELLSGCRQLSMTRILFALGFPRYWCAK